MARGRRIKRQKKEKTVETYSCGGLLETYTCPTCPFQTNFKLHLQNHLILHTSRPKPKCKFLSYVCQKCQFTTHSILTLHKHVSDRCGRIRWFKCDLCTFKSYRQEYLKRHKKNKHTFDRDTRWFECKLCNHRTRWKGNLKDHIAIVHSQNKVYKCNVCDYKSGWKKVLKRHVMKKHYYDTSPKFLKCAQCSYETIRNDCLKRHIKAMHSESKSLKSKCDICNFQTRRSDHLKRHIKQVHGIRSAQVTRPIVVKPAPQLSLEDFGIQCEIVPKAELQELMPPPLTGYVQIKPRDQVVDAPPQERWFSCDQCPFSAKLQSSLKIHKLSHKKGNDRVVYFKCALCPLQSDRKDNLRRHIRETHMEWKRQSQDLIKTGVFNGQRFYCDLCPFSTEWMNSLNLHKMLSHGFENLVPR